MSLGIAGLLGTAATSIAADAPAPKAEAPKADAAKPEGPKVSQKAIDAGKKIDWEKMDENAKKKYMKSTVLPEMKKLFVAVDKKHYSNMGCQTCHGEKAVENKFKMPNASLPKLPQPTDRAGFMALQQKKPEIVKFMGTAGEADDGRAAREEGMGAEQPRRLRLLRLPHEGSRRRGAGRTGRRASRAPAAPPGKGW